MSLYRTICLLILFLLSASIYGQEPVYKITPPQYELEHIKLNFKSDPGDFQDVTEDKEGNLWIVSTRGLHVYDGHNITNYRTGNKAHSLSPGALSDLFHYCTPDQSGSLWITDNFNRLIQFDPAKRRIIDSFTEKPPPDERYFMLASHRVSGLFFTWINYEKPVISLYHKTENGSAEKNFETKFNITGNILYRLVGNNHWIIDGDNAIRLSLDGKQVSRYAYPRGTSQHLLVFSNDSSIYIADIERQAIYTWNEATDKLEHFCKLPYIETDKAEAFYIEDNRVYLASNLYLSIIDLITGTVQDISPQFTELARKEAPNTLSQQLIQFFRQKDGSLLLVTTGTIFRLKKKVPPPGQFRQQVDAENNSLKPVSYRALAEDDRKNIYASYYTGISKKTAGKTSFSKISTNQYLNSRDPSTYSLHYRNGFLLWNNVKIEIATGKHHYMFDSVFSGHCTQFLQHDSLWLYKWGSKQLHGYDLKQDKLTSYPIELSTNVTASESSIMDINDMVADASGKNLWIGSHFFGLCQISKKGKLIKQYRHRELTTTDDYITDLELTGNQLWFGCTDGLGVLNTVTGKARIYKNPFVNNGLLSNRSVFSIQADSAGNFYLGSSHGLLYFDTKAAAFFNLAEGHPLSTPEFNRASVFKASDNRYYFGSTDGLYSFTPGELEFFRSSNAISPIKLYGISVFSNKDKSYHYLYQNLDSLGKLILHPFDNNIELSFSVPEFYRDIYYSYRIKGQGDNWTEYKPDNKIQLYGLQAGNYTLEVKASTSLSDENASYYLLPIEVKQVWYKKWWIISLCLLAVAALLFGLLRYRFNQKIKMQKDLAALRTRISSDLHDDVGTILSGLAMQSQMLTYSVDEEHKAPLKEISSMSREAMEHMRDTVWAMDSRKDKYENLVDRMKGFAEKNLPMKKMTHEFMVENVEGKRFIDPEKRQAIYLIFKEAITNILKHSDGNHVVIYFTEEKNKTILRIRDNGSEKDKSNSDGLGMSNMKMRAEKIGGTLTSDYENGFVVELTL